jgi:dTMP kinase
LKSVLVRARAGFTGLQLVKHGLPGKLISVSGTDGSGKTTTLRTLAAYYRSQGRQVHTFKLPSRQAKNLKPFISYRYKPLEAVASAEVDIFALCITLLGDRLSTVRSEIIPLLCKGVTVLVDRYLFTVLGEFLLHDPPLGREYELLRHIVALFPQPDLMIFTSVSQETAAARILARPHDNSADAHHEVLQRRMLVFRHLQQAFGGVEVKTDRGVADALKQILKYISEKELVHEPTH